MNRAAWTFGFLAFGLAVVSVGLLAAGSTSWGIGFAFGALTALAAARGFRGGNPDGW